MSATTQANTSAAATAKVMPATSPSSSVSTPPPPSPPVSSSPPPSSPTLSSTSTSIRDACCAATRTIQYATVQPRIAWNEYIAKPTNALIKSVNVPFQSHRRDNPLLLISGSTLLVAAASIPFTSKFGVLRNTSLALFASSMAVEPASTIGTLVYARDRLAAASGINTPRSIIVQVQPQPPQTNGKPAAYTPPTTPVAAAKPVVVAPVVKPATPAAPPSAASTGASK